MKKRKVKFIAIFLCIILLTGVSGVAFGASDYWKTIKVEIGKTKVISNGKTINEQTITWDNRTYVPLRATVEAAGCNVGWDEATKTATVENNGRPKDNAMAKAAIKLNIYQNNLFYLGQIGSSMNSYLDLVITNGDRDFATIHLNYAKEHSKIISSELHSSDFTVFYDTWEEEFSLPQYGIDAKEMAAIFDDLQNIAEFGEVIAWSLETASLSDLSDAIYEYSSAVANLNEKIDSYNTYLLKNWLQK